MNKIARISSDDKIEYYLYDFSKKENLLKELNKDLINFMTIMIRYQSVNNKIKLFYPFLNIS